MKHWQGVIVLVAALGHGCGGDAAVCAKDACSGPYFVNIDQTSGTCAGLASAPATLEQCIEPSLYCTVNSETWSSNDCTVTRKRTCFAVGLDTRSEQVWTVTQSETGDTLSGTLTTSLSRISDGRFMCTGSYVVSGARE